MPVFNIGPEYSRPALRVATSELLKSGVTTICDLGTPRELADEYAETGIRAVLWGMFRSGPWKTPTAIRSITTSTEPPATASAGSHFERRRGVKAPERAHHRLFRSGAIDTCTEDQIRDALDAARERNQPIQIHAAQSIVEFQEIMRRYGCTPIEWLEKSARSGPTLIIGHCIFLNDHPLAALAACQRFRRLRDSGAQVAHCPVVFARRGIALNTLEPLHESGHPMRDRHGQFPAQYAG